MRLNTPLAHNDRRRYGWRLIAAFMPAGFAEMPVNSVENAAGCVIDPAKGRTDLDPGAGFEPASRRSERRILPLDDPGIFAGLCRFAKVSEKVAAFYSTEVLV